MTDYEHVIIKIRFNKLINRAGNATLGCHIQNSIYYLYSRVLWDYFYYTKKIFYSHKNDNNLRQGQKLCLYYMRQSTFLWILARFRFKRTVLVWPSGLHRTFQIVTRNMGNSRRAQTSTGVLYGSARTARITAVQTVNDDWTFGFVDSRQKTESIHR